MLRNDAAIWYWTDREHSLEDAHAEHVAWVNGYNADRAKEGPNARRTLRQSNGCVRICEIQDYDTYSTKFGKAKAD